MHVKKNYIFEMLNDLKEYVFLKTIIISTRIKYRPTVFDHRKKVNRTCVKNVYTDITYIFVSFFFTLVRILYLLI